MEDKDIEEIQRELDCFHSHQTTYYLSETIEEIEDREDEELYWHLKYKQFSFALITRLGLKERNVFILYNLYGLNKKQIAEKLEIPYKDVKKILNETVIFISNYFNLDLKALKNRLKYKNFKK